MSAAPLPAREPERLDRLIRLGVLDTLPQRAFDDITALAQAVCGTPIALISLVDRDRQWFKARRGTDLTETPRHQAFCAHAIHQPDDVLVVPHPETDARFADNPLVTGEPGVRFYAGAPIVTSDGFAVGTVCVLDHQSRPLDATQMDALRRLAALVATLLEHGQAHQEQQAQQLDAARASTERLTAMAAATLDLQAFLDADGIYRHVNQTYLDYNACRAQDVIGQHVSARVGDALFRNVVGPQLERALRGEPVFYQRVVTYRGRGPRHMEVALLPVRQNGGPVSGVVMRAHDIEPLKDNEQRLASTVAELERKTREQQRFIHLLAHDLREPVNAVNNFGGLLHDDHRTHLPLPAQRYLGFVREGGQRLSRLVDSMAEYAQLEEHEPQMAPVDMAALAHELRASMTGPLATSGGRIDIGPLPVMRGDAVLLRLALRHLVGNALKFARPGVAPHVQLAGARDGAFDRIDIRDNGIGIAPEHQAAVFDLFNRLHHRRQYDGTGLGLSICQRVADLHRGHLTLTSAPAEGSTFTLHLPARPAGTA